MTLAPPTQEYDLFSLEFAEHRADVLRELRERHPIHWHENYGFWTFARYADVERTARDTKRFSSLGSPAILDDEGTPNYEVQVRRLSARDDPGHKVLRKLSARAFTRRRLKELELSLSTMAHTLLDDVEAKLLSGQSVDYVRDFAYRLPVLAVNAILGVPDDVLEFLTDYDTRAKGTVLDYFADLVERRRLSPGDDVISQIVSAVDDGNEYLTPDEVHYFVAGFWTAGNLTTTNLFSHAALALQDMPEAARDVASDPHLMEGFIEEVLRTESPTTASFKIAKNDVEVDGHLIRRGQKVWLMWAAANRDPGQFPDPDTFDMRRNPNQHLAFSHGPHYCLGAPLARLESRIGLQALLQRRLPMRLDVENAQRIWGRNQYGFQTIPITPGPHGWPN
jgi:cytochrome P450